VCRVMPPLTEQCAARSIALGHAVAPHAEWLAQQLARAPLPELPAGMPRTAPQSSRRQGPGVPTPLTQDRRRAAQGKAPLREGVPPIISNASRRCTECGEPRSRDSRGLCRACLERLAPGLRASRMTIERKVASGRPLFSRRVLASKRRKMVVHHAKRRAWQAAHPTVPSIASFRRTILPSLRRVTVAAIARATGMSRPYCSAVRAGRRVPHPVHWEALKAIGRAPRR
jgi:hypothetical protein